MRACSAPVSFTASGKCLGLTANSFEGSGARGARVGLDLGAHRRLKVLDALPLLGGNLGGVLAQPVGGAAVAPRAHAGSAPSDA